MHSQQSHIAHAHGPALESGHDRPAATALLLGAGARVLVAVAASLVLWLTVGWALS